jgi:hypothetical protein
METRADMLRRQIAQYRESLRSGVDCEVARRYLRAITEAETELARIDGQRQPESC